MNEIKPDSVLDLKGVACPSNFVRAKLRLEDMQKDEILEIIIDDGEPIKNVPRSIKEEGHQILKAEKVDNYWKLVIKKQ
ncbi:MAG: sulfurtransferase TusA family protein [Candidatus Omnitrophota bacterium]|nr:sulfurtransferase TusA family protein [Candidatus Omnitrophota bacterium]